MKLAGSPLRMELHPETDEEREFLQRALDERREHRGHDLLYWGDADTGWSTGAFIINGHYTPPLGFMARLRQRFRKPDFGGEPAVVE